MSQPTHAAKYYAELTDAQLAADLLRWADVRDGINRETKWVNGKEVPVDREGGALASLNLREAAERLKVYGELGITIDGYHVGKFRDAMKLEGGEDAAR